MEELDVLIRSSLKKSILVYGNRSTGKTHGLLHSLEKYNRKHVFIDCANVVDYKLLLNKINYQITQKLQKFETIEDLFSSLEDVTSPITLVLKNLQSIQTNTLNYDLFKLFNSIEIKGISIIFIVSSTTIPTGLVTGNIMKVYFKNLDQKDVEATIVKKGVLPISNISRNYIKLIVNTYYPYTTDIKELETIVTENWSAFVSPLESDPQLAFVDLYNSFKLKLSDQLITKRVAKITSDLTQNGELSPLSSILLISSYLASYNDPRFDFTLFSKLKEIRSGKRTFSRRVRNGNVRKIINNLRFFEFERMISIMKSIHKDTDYFESAELKIDLLTYIEFNNLVTLRLLVKNENKYKINCDFAFVKECSEQVGFLIENYLAE